MRRRALGIASLLLIVTGGAIYVWHAGSGAVLMRAGVACGVLWLAYPQLKQVPKILWIGIVLFAISLAVRPKLAPVFLVLLIAIAILRPRRRSASTDVQRSRR
jgi:hypothetical protein